MKQRILSLVPAACIAVALGAIAAGGCRGDHPPTPHTPHPPTPDTRPPPAPTPSTARPMPPTPPRPFSDAQLRDIRAEAVRRGLPGNGFLLIADIATQRAILADADGVVADYRMSSSKFGIGSEADSYKTPLGWHRVVQRFGGEHLQGTIFQARQPLRRILRPDEWQSDAGEDHVLTRILWLSGLEPGRNQGGRVDSFNRCIYIHGTNQEHLLGTPASHGCIRLSNRDVMELYDLTEGRELYCLIR